MATVRVTRNFPSLERVELITRQDMADLGAALLLRIRQRTARGVDAEGQPFAPYSTRYRETKGAYTLGAKASVVGPVDLTVTGEMLNAMTVVEATESTVTLGWLR